MRDRSGHAPLLPTVPEELSGGPPQFSPCARTAGNAATLHSEEGTLLPLHGSTDRRRTLNAVFRGPAPDTYPQCAALAVTGEPPLPRASIGSTFRVATLPSRS